MAPKAVITKEKAMVYMVKILFAVFTTGNFRQEMRL